MFRAVTNFHDDIEVFLARPASHLADPISCMGIADPNIGAGARSQVCLFNKVCLLGRKVVGYYEIGGFSVEECLTSRMVGLIEGLTFI